MNILILRTLLLFLSLIFKTIISAQIEYGDVIISELMIDPSPTKHLPSEEYIEIQNRCIDTINLGQLIYSDERTSISLEGFLAPDEFLILCNEDDVVLFEQYGSVLGLSSWPSLNNDEDKLCIKTTNNDTIFYLHYDINLMDEILDQDGGYALECKGDNDQIISFYEDYHYSSNENGGTPGTINSLNGINLIDDAFNISKIELIGGRLHFETKTRYQTLCDINLFSQQGQFLYQLRDDYRLMGNNNLMIDLNEFPLNKPSICIVQVQLRNSNGDTYLYKQAISLIIKDM